MSAFVQNPFNIKYSFQKAITKFRQKNEHVYVFTILLTAEFSYNSFNLYKAYRNNNAGCPPEFMKMMYD